MKTKKKRGVEVTMQIFIDTVISYPFESIQVPLASFNWVYDKGDFYQWTELMKHFDSFYEKYIQPCKELQLEGVSDQSYSFPREAVLQVLRVTRVILENCINKHCYGSCQHLCSLLASMDTEIVISSLQTLAAFVKKPVQSNRPLRWHGDHTLKLRLFSLCQGWGVKEEGLGLVACAIEGGCDSNALRLASTLHFEFYVNSVWGADKDEGVSKSTGLKIIHLESIQGSDQEVISLFCDLIERYKVPLHLRFPLLARLRFARSFSDLHARRQYLSIRLLAFIILVQLNAHSEDLSAFYNNEPEFVNELVSLLLCEDTVPEDIRLLAVSALAAQAHDRTRQSNVMSAITAGDNLGILPTLVQNAVGCLRGLNSNYSLSFVEALLHFVTVLVSNSVGCASLRESGLIPALLPLLKDTEPLHIHLIASGVRILEAFMDYSNPAATLFRDLGGLDDAISRLGVEVKSVEETISRHQLELARLEKGKTPISGDLQHHSSCIEMNVSFQSRLLLRVLLRTVSLGTYAPGNNWRNNGSEEGSLPSSLCTIFKHAKEFGGGVFALAASLMSDLIHKDPTGFAALDSAGLPEAFLDAIMRGVLPSSDAVSCIPHSLDALCLNNAGLEAVKERNALGFLVNIFTSQVYLKALSSETLTLLASGFDELMRHTPTLRADGVKACIEILEKIALIGGDVDKHISAVSQEGRDGNVPIHMESDSYDDVHQRNAADVTELSNTDNHIMEYIQNVARFLEPLLQNAETARIFVENKGVEAFLKLYSLPNNPASFGGSSIAHSMSSAFRSFSPIHAGSLSRAVCRVLRESLCLSVDALNQLNGNKISELPVLERDKVIRCLASTELYLSLAAVLVRSTNSMLSELNANSGDLLTDIGKVYQSALWQISLLDNEKDGLKEESINTSAINGNVSGSREGTENTLSNVQYVNPLSIHNAANSQWDGGLDAFLSMATGGGLHRRTRREHGSVYDSFSQRLRRLSRHNSAQVAQVDIEAPYNAGDGFQPLETARHKSSDSINFEVVTRLVSSARGFFVALGKAMVVPSRRRDNAVSPGSIARAVAGSIGNLLHDSLVFHHQFTSARSEASECQYLRKLVEDILLLLFDNRRHTCNMVIMNSFYGQDVFGRLLQEFQNMSQLLWRVLETPGVSFKGDNECENCFGNKKICVLGTLQCFARLFEHLVTPSLLLSPQSQTLVHQTANAVVPLPRDPETLVQKLQSQVLQVVFPVWNHHLFGKCNETFISTIASVLTHIYSGIDDTNDHRNANSRALGPPPDEGSISMIVEMGFSRERAEEALRRVVTNSVEMAMEWLFSNPEEPHEDDDLARALALSLGSSDVSVDAEGEGSASACITNEDHAACTPPVEDIMCICFTLMQSTDSVVFSLADLIVTICNRNKGQDRARVVNYLISQLKSCPKDDLDSDTSLLSIVSHFLAVILSEDGAARESAAEQGLVSVVLDILSIFHPQLVLETSVAAPKWTTSLLLVLDLFLHYKHQALHELQSSMTMLTGTGTTSNAKLNESGQAFMDTLGRYSGYMSVDEQHRAMTIACNFLNSHIPATSVQAVLQLCARLTKTNSVALQFLEAGGLNAILSLPRRSLFPGFDTVAAVIIHHLLEDPCTLQQAMELEIRQTLTATPHRHGQMNVRMFLTALAPVILRNPEIFMQASASVCKIVNVNGQNFVALSKDKEKEKNTDKDGREGEREKPKSDGTCRAQDSAGKSTKSHHKVHRSFVQVIEQLIEVVLLSPGSFSQKAMDVSTDPIMEKGKSEGDAYDVVGQGSLSERSAGLAKVAFILKLMTEIILMYPSAVSIVLHCDSEIIQGRLLGQELSTSGGGFLHHILHNLLPSRAGRLTEKCTENEWREKLSLKAAHFLHAFCIRSLEGQRRIISEVSTALLSSARGLAKLGKWTRQPPSRDVKAFVILINIMLSAHASSHSSGSGFSTEIIKVMVEAGLVQALTTTVQVTDLDHPEAVKFLNAVLRALEVLSRAAATSDQGSSNTQGNENFGVGEPSFQSIHGEVQTRNNNQDSRATPTVISDLIDAQLTVPTEGHAVSGDLIEADHPMHTVVAEDEMQSEETALIQEPDVNLSREGEGQAANISVHVEHMPEIEQTNDDEEMDVVEEDDEEEEGENEMDAAEDVTHLSLPDTDVDEQDDQGLGDEYSEDIADEEEDDWQEDQVTEVQWRDGFTRFDDNSVVGPGGSTSSVDIPREPFQSMNEIFSTFNRSTAIDRHRPSSVYRPHSDRRGGDHGGAFQHPLLTRLPVSASNAGALSNNAGWTSSGVATSNSNSLSAVGTVDASPFYMHNRLLSVNGGDHAFGEHSMGGPLPPLLDFSIDSGYMMSRRGARAESRLSIWTDDGLPQGGAHASTIAQCVEAHYITYLGNFIPEIPGSIAMQTDALGDLEVDTGLTNQQTLQAVEHAGDGVDIPRQRQPNFVADAPMPTGHVITRVSCNERLDERTAATSCDGEVELQRAVQGDDLCVVDAREGMLNTQSDQAVPINNEGSSASDANETNMEVEVSRNIENIIGEPQEQQEEVHRQQSERIPPVYDHPAQCDVGHGSQAEGAGQQAAVEQVGAQEAGVSSGGVQDANTIDPTFLEALPDYLRAEVLASHETQGTGTVTAHPPPLATEDIDPEFLAALPPDIQAEVLQQQRNQRSVQPQQAEGQPVEMDVASIIATFPAEIREEVLLTSSDQFLSTLFPSLLAEAQLLRERAMNQYQGSGLFGGSNRFGFRRHNALSSLDRAIGNTTGLTVTRRTGTPTDVNRKAKEVEGKPLVSSDGLKCLLQLLYLAQPLGNVLQRVLLNLCAHGVTRVRLFKFLLDLLRPSSQSTLSEVSRLYGCRSNVVYARSLVSEAGVPPLVSRRVLEVLAYLSKHLGPGSNILTCLPSSANILNSEDNQKGKAKLTDNLVDSSKSSEEEAPLVLLLRLLNEPLYFHSSVHLEQLMVLLEVVTSHLNTELQMLKQASIGGLRAKDNDHATQSDTNLGERESGVKRNAGSSRQTKGVDGEQPQSYDASTSGTDYAVQLSEILSNLPEAELRKLCSLLAHPGFSESAYSHVAEVLKKIACIAPSHCWLLKEELENSVRHLCGPAVHELESLSGSATKVLSTNSVAGTAVLRVLQCLSKITDSSGKPICSGSCDLSKDLELLWQGLSSCVAKLEGTLGSTCSTSGALTLTTGTTSTALPAETRRVLPFVEAFFVLSEKLKSSTLQSLHLEPGAATAREIKEAISSSSTAVKKSDGDVSFMRFAEKHRRMLNAFIHQNPSLLESSFSVLLKTPRLIDFDNKRTYFQSRIKQQQDQRHHHPLRICVRRPYVLEDSYNQLRMRTIEELKGRLTVQFQGEEGIDAGGLTREWYQLLSRVIFDKGALLFTTVGNDSTFQPNPNSVFQTEHLSYFKFVGRVVAKALLDWQLLDVYFTRSFYKHILGVKVTYHDIEAVDPDYYKNLKWMLENDINDVVDVFFSVDADEEKHILYEKTEVTDVELVPGGRNIRVTEENKHEYVDLNAEHKLTTAIRPQINAFLEGFNELVSRDLISIFNDKELELLISGLPEIDLEDLKANTEYTGYTPASTVIQWFWEIVQDFNKEDMARLLQFITGTSKVPLEGFQALQGVSGPQKCQIHKAYGAPERLPTAHTCFNQLDLPEYSSKQQLQERLLLAIHEGSEGFGFG
ncbi:hypothetical protein KP509_10G067500 [Ceratopteris richardii]|uniref:HECT-type E3 ubiquitin transferase n=1 Tax=Ceratopteris richardii TaxID=49495 RepID=A0A8T2TZY6_CERRI|nr:hypothetical protein KP509_10G067500 [Ceratopteris richardii]